MKTLSQAHNRIVVETAKGVYKVEQERDGRWWAWFCGNSQMGSEGGYLSEKGSVVRPATFFKRQEDAIAAVEKSSGEEFFPPMSRCSQCNSGYTKTDPSNPQETRCRDCQTKMRVEDANEMHKGKCP